MQIRPNQVKGDKSSPSPRCCFNFKHEAELSFPPFPKFSCRNRRYLYVIISTADSSVLQKNEKKKKSKKSGFYCSYCIHIQTCAAFAIVQNLDVFSLLASFHLHKAFIAVRFAICSTHGGQIFEADIFALALRLSVSVHLANLGWLASDPLTRV